jgi:uncharacterized BrkB/YihY/UPF0761 family membrane protein
MNISGENILKKPISAFLLSIYYFFSNGLLNHAASLAFFFILSVVPALMFSIYFASLLLVKNQAIYEQVLTIVKEFNNFIWNFLSNGDYGVYSFNFSDVGLLNIIALLFSSTLFVRSILRVFEQIFNKPCYKSLIISYLVPIFVNLFSVILIILLISSILILKIVMNKMGIGFVDEYLNISMLTKLLSTSPFIILFMTSFFMYKIFAWNKIKWKTALIISVLFSLNIYLIKYLFNENIFAPSQISIYGSASIFLLTIISFYVIFIFFLFWIQFGFIYENTDILILRFIIDSDKSVLFRENIINFIYPIIKNNIQILNANQQYEIPEEKWENIFYISRGKIKISNQIFDESNNNFFIPKDLFSDNNSKIFYATLENSVIINMDKETYQLMLDESEQLKKAVIGFIENKV